MSTTIPLDKPLDISTDETVLVELDTLLLKGMMAWHVRFTLTDQRAQFRVTRLLERAAGAKGDAFWVDELEDVSWSRVTQQVHIKLRSRSLRLSGGDAHTAYRHLKSLVAPEETQARAIASQRTFLPGENILLEGPIDVVVRAPLWASGTVQLTNHRIRFKPSRGLQRLVLSDRPVEVRLEELAGFCVARGGTSLQLLWLYEPEEGEAPELEVAMEFVRGSMTALAAAFMAMGAPQLTANEVAPSNLKVLKPPIFVTAGRYGNGALARTGMLALGPGGFWFASGDLVASVAGTSTDGLALAEIQRIEINPSNPKAASLVPRGDRPPQSIETDTFAFQPRNIAQLMASVWPTTGPTLDRYGRLDTRDVRNLARMNNTVLPPGSTTGDIRGAGAVRIGRHGRISRGWLLALSSGALFVALGGHADDRCFLEGPLIDRSRSGTDDEGILRIVVERKEERYAICGGAPTANAIWKTLCSQLPDAKSMASRFPFLDAITGRIGYVRLSHRQLEILARRMVTTRLEREGIGFAVGDNAPDIIAPGLDIEVEMGNQEVVYCFRTHIARVDAPDTAKYVVIGLSSKVHRRENRRRAFRVAVEQTITLHRQESHLARPDPTGFEVALANLSWTGISVLVDETIPTGTLLTAELTLEESAEWYRFEVIHTRKLPGESRILHGCRFLDLSAGQQDHIQSAVIRQQMREVYAQEYGEPEPETPNDEARPG